MVTSFIHFAIFLTNMGKQIVAGSVKHATSGPGLTEPNWIGWGSGAGTTTAADTSLFTEETEARVAGTSSLQTGTVTNDTYRVVGTMTAGGTKSITNAGLFDGSNKATANLFVKGDHAAIPVQLNDTVTYTFDTKFQ